MSREIFQTIFGENRILIANIVERPKFSMLFTGYLLYSFYNCVMAFGGAGKENNYVPICKIESGAVGKTPGSKSYDDVLQRGICRGYRRHFLEGLYTGTDCRNGGVPCNAYFRGYCGNV